MVVRPARDHQYGSPVAAGQRRAYDSLGLRAGRSSRRIPRPLDPLPLVDVMGRPRRVVPKLQHLR